VGGSLRDVKASYGRNLISLRAVGGDAIIADRSIVASTDEHSDEMQIELTEGTDAQVLLRRLIDSGATITKFEHIEPSLNDIFIDQIGGESKVEALDMNDKKKT